MSSAARALRLQHQHTFCFFSTRATALRQPHWSSIRRLASSHRRSRIAEPHFPDFTSAKHSAIDPRTFLIAAVLSCAVAYTTIAYTAKDEAPRQQPAEEVSPLAAIALGAESPFYTMALNNLPGRPGNLTAEQETKLKEMWATNLEFFGMSHEEVTEAQANGTLNPSRTPTSPESTPKKKKGGLMSRFRGKGKEEEEPSSPTGGVDNDKHGQVKEYEEALASMKPEQIQEAFWNMTKHDHPDAILLRFLRARKWDVHAAQVMALSTLHWRLKDMHVDDDIMIRGEGHAIAQSKSDDASEKKLGEDFLAQMRMGKSFLHGLDKDGRPCCYVRVRLHHGGEQCQESLERFTVYTIETARMMLRPPVDTATIVFDMTDFSMANMDYTPVKFMIKCFEANYPESLGSVLVYKAPWIFSGIWKIIKGWLDPVVAGKVHFASNEKELEEWIPRSRIPKEMGGDEDWEYKYVEPHANEDTLLGKTEEKEPLLVERKELTKAYESATLAWIKGEDRTAERNELAEKMAVNYWKLDPYIRARSLYDRTGIIGPMGKLDVYADKNGHAEGKGESEVD
ncbi:hypothetical protein PRZ48_011509 [Zasmidium cellare]|uniref:CRAL-TRIO domain-containing protein n=1 Tax=Zasmidium cellare TaxID=395010 RepID=A0ABR0E6J5_ZASCE|nr:hypothetical protein PRZ48_011509 [Zasmidium cellare]